MKDTEAIGTENASGNNVEETTHSANFNSDRWSRDGTGAENHKTT